MYTAEYLSYGGYIMLVDEKYLNAVHYIISTCESTEQLGTTKLNNILLFVDGFLYRKNGQTLTGDTYIKRKRGLTPKNILKVKNALVKQNKISIRKDTKPHSFCSQIEPDLSFFSEVEIEAMYSTASYISSNYSVKEIAEISRTSYWESSELGKEIDFGGYFGGKKSRAKKTLNTTKTSKTAKDVKDVKSKTIAIKDTEISKASSFKRTHR